MASAARKSGQLMSLRQSATDSSRQRSADGEGRSSCWHRERDQACLRVEVTPDESFIFPYQQFLGAHHIRQRDSETLVISFSTHEITASGRELGKIASALQDLAVEWIKAVPARYGALPETKGAGAWIKRLDVRAVE